MTRRRGMALALAIAAAWVGVLAADPSAQVRKWPSERPPKPLTARDFTFPHYEVRTLPNGLQVVVVPHHEQPAVTLQLLVRAGSADDPVGKAGVANLVASLLDQGTSSRTAQQIASEIDSIGGQLEVLAGTDVIVARATVMTDSFRMALELLSDVCRAPAFAADELTRQVLQLRSGLRVRYDDPDYVAGVVFDRLVYGVHPYGQPGSGTPQSIERIARDDLVRFHEQFFAPNNSLLAVVGDLAADEAFLSVDAVLGPWERREIPVSPVAALPRPEKRVVVVDKPDAVQTEIRMGHVAIARSDRDYLPLDMAVRVLGGEGVNRLQQVLRMRRALTYGASADLLAHRLTGDINAETETRSETTGEAVRVMMDEFFRLRRETVGERELDAVKAYMAGSYPLSIETPAAISTKVLNALFYGLPLEELRGYGKRVGAVSPEDIRRVTRAHLGPDRLAVVLVGNAAAFKDQLRSVGLRNVEVIPLRELDVTAADFRAPVTAAPAEAPPSPAHSPSQALPPGAGDPPPRERVEPTSVVQRAIDAAGGIEALRQVKTLRATAETLMHTPDGPLQTRTTTWVEYPNRIRVEAETSSGHVVQAYDDGHAWIQDAHGPRDAPDAMRDAFAASVRRDWIALLLTAADRRLSARALPDWRGVGGRLEHGVELFGDGLPATRVYIDAASARLVRLVYDTPGPRGNETTTESFSDFHLVDGVSVPFKAVVQRGNAPVLERTLTGIVFNEPIPSGLFTKPPPGRAPR